MNYAQSISGGSLQTSAVAATTMQDNELVSFCRDAGLITEKFSNARVQSLMKDVGNAFKSAKDGPKEKARAAELARVQAQLQSKEEECKQSALQLAALQAASRGEAPDSP